MASAIGCAAAASALTSSCGFHSPQHECRSEPFASGAPASDPSLSPNGRPFENAFPAFSAPSSLILRFPPNFKRQLSIKARRNCSNIGVAQVVAASATNLPALSDNVATSPASAGGPLPLAASAADLVAGIPLPPCSTIVNGSSQIFASDKSSTVAVHAGERSGRPKVSDALTTPIVQTSTYTFTDTAQLIAYQVNEEEKENLRRKRISEANRGKVPWNKGGKHSSETKMRIRAGVIERMKDPKIREKLRLQAEVVKMSPEIKFKIRTGIIRAWKEKRKLRVKQEVCLLEWKEVIAEAARRGLDGDVEYEWDSCSILRRQARAAVPRKTVVRTLKPDHLSAEHRLRISAAIKAKWSDPDYRINVEKGIRKAVKKRVVSPTQIRPRAERTFSRPVKRPTVTENHNLGSDGDLVSEAKVTPKSAPKMRSPKPISLNSNNLKDPASLRHVFMGGLKGALRTDTTESDSSKLNADVPAYKDPEAEKKLEKLKSMRAHRMHIEAKKHKEITERARFLIAQAQEAAKALEATAVKDKNALAPLLETRKLLAEAVLSLESMNRKSSIPDYVVKEDDSALYAHVMSLANAVSSPLANTCDHPRRESSGVESSNSHS